jgi:hypothetical protein
VIKLPAIVIPHEAILPDHKIKVRLLLNFLVSVTPKYAFIKLSFKDYSSKPIWRRQGFRGITRTTGNDKLPGTK